jgi:hypothetical protein
VSITVRLGGLAGALLLSVYLTAPVFAAKSASPTTCRISQFVLSLGPEISEATGQHTLALRLVSVEAWLVP